MGMYCGLYKLSPEDADRLLKNPGMISTMISYEPTDGSYLSLEKAWHGLHYLLTGHASGGPQPLSFIFAGGQDIGVDLGYGPARLLSARFVKDLDSSLSELTINEIWLRFDPAKMSKEGIYPEIWDEPEEELKDEYGMYFNELKDFVRSASSNDNSIVMVIV
jgi:hypothetical protein